jgi:hypothetical protein
MSLWRLATKLSIDRAAVLTHSTYNLVLCLNSWLGI